jgi:hypothetical protein
MEIAYFLGKTRQVGGPALEREEHKKTNVLIEFKLRFVFRSLQYTA